MDIMQEYAIQLLQIYNTADPYIGTARQYISEIQSRTYPIMLPYLDRLSVFAQNSPAIITVGLLALFIVVSWKILNTMRRIMMWWFRLCVKLAMWGVVVVVIGVVMQRGVGETVEDVVGWGKELSEVWWREYRRWEGYQNQSYAHNQGRVMGNIGGNGRTGWR